MNTLERISQHSFLPALVRKESLVLDLGGNRGEFSRGIQKYGFSVIAVEPTPALANHLRQSGVQVIEAAVTGQDGTASFTFSEHEELTGSILGRDVVDLLGEDSTTIEVPTLSLGSLLNGRTVDLVKVDIEGAELDMFLKADDETLLSVRQFTVEFHDFWYLELGPRTEAVKQRMERLGFWTMRGTPNNKDVLFVHPDFAPGAMQRIYIGQWLRNINGFGRALAIVCRRIFSR